MDAKNRANQFLFRMLLKTSKKIKNLYINETMEPKRDLSGVTSRNMMYAKKNKTNALK